MPSTRRTRVPSYRRKDGTRVSGHEKNVHVSNGKSATASALREKAGDSAEGIGYYTGLLGRAIKDGVKSMTERHEVEIDTSTSESWFEDDGTEHYTHHGVEIEIRPDYDSLSPRESMSNFSTFSIWDTNNASSDAGAIEPQHGGYDVEGFVAELLSRHDVAAITPLYESSHGSQFEIYAGETWMARDLEPALGVSDLEARACLDPADYR